MRTRETSVFVIMPFAPEFMGGYTDVIRPAVERLGLSCVRADQESLGPIHRDMFRRIFDSPALVADISGGNPNVFYELGVAHTVSRTTITIVREDFIGQVPFDIAPYRVLIYPKRPTEDAEMVGPNGYQARVEEAVQRLSTELQSILQEGGGISNPVQDFMVTRSPITSQRSQYLDRLGGDFEEELVRHARQDLVYTGVTGVHVANLLTAQLEANRRRTPLSAQLLLLDPEDQPSWEFLYRLREGDRATPAGFEDFWEESRFLIRRSVRMIERLASHPHFSGSVKFYSGVVLFWAYLIDSERMLLGHLAARRTTSHNLPVQALVRSDLTTRPLFDYYCTIIQSLAGPDPLTAVAPEDDSPPAADDGQNWPAGI